MKTKREILELIKDELINKRVIHHVNERNYMGLCSVNSTLYFDRILTSKEHSWFMEFWETYARNRYSKIFYTHENKVTTCEKYFGWKPQLIEPRVEWLDKQIEKS